MEGVIHTMKPRKEDGDGLTVLVAQKAEVLQRLVPQSHTTQIQINCDIKSGSTLPLPIHLCLTN